MSELDSHTVIRCCSCVSHGLLWASTVAGGWDLCKCLKYLARIN